MCELTGRVLAAKTGELLFMSLDNSLHIYGTDDKNKNKK